MHSRSVSDELGNYSGTWGPAQKQKEADGQRATKLGWGFGIGGLALAIGGGVTHFIGTRNTGNGYAIVPTRNGGAFVWSTTW